MQKVLGAVLGVAIVAAVLGGIVFRYAERPAETPAVSADNGTPTEKNQLIEPEPAQPEPNPESAPAAAPDAGKPAAASDPTTPAEPPEPDLAAGDAQPAVDSTSEQGPGSDPALEPEPGPAPEQEPAVEPEPEPDPGLEPVIPTPVSLYVFWGPFDLESSARGFADRIAELTGLTVDVVEKTAGEYMAAFQYRTEAEKEEAIELIEKEARLKIRPEETP